MTVSPVAVARSILRVHTHQQMQIVLCNGNKMNSKIRVSSCLLGEAVRYDGVVKGLEHALLATLGD